jgi:hypothetical protein
MRFLQCKAAKGIMAAGAIMSLLAAGGCASSVIGERPGVDRVSLADASQVGSCQPKGEETITVLSKVLFVTRNAEDVEANLYQMARNYAVDNGADTVVKGASKEFGTRDFAIYKCRP